MCWAPKLPIWNIKMAAIYEKCQIGQNSIKMAVFSHYLAMNGKLWVRNKFSTHIECQTWSGKSFMKIGCPEVPKPGLPSLTLTSWVKDASPFVTFVMAQMALANYKIAFKPEGIRISAIPTNWLFKIAQNWINNHNFTFLPLFSKSTCFIQGCPKTPTLQFFLTFFKMHWCFGASPMLMRNHLF